jgi:hypothetical protein
MDQWKPNWSVTRSANRLTRVFFLQAQDLSVICTATPGIVTPLTSGNSTAPFALSPEAISVFTIEVSEGDRVRCDMAASTGDPDIALRWGSEPFFLEGQFDCVSISDGSSESCVVDNSGSTSKLWIKVEAFSQSDGIELTCTTGILVSVIPLAEGVASDSISLASGQTQLYKFELDSFAQVTCETFSLRGDLDLVLRWDFEPNIDELQYDCIGFSVDGVERCTVEAAASSTALYAALVSYRSTVVAASLTCTSVASAVIMPLFDGEASESFGLSEGLSQEFVMGVLSTAESIYCRTFGGLDGDADLYVRYNTKPEIGTGSYDCASAGVFAFEECTLSDLDGVSSLYITVSAYTQTSDLSVLCTSAADVSTEVITLELGVSTAPFSLQITQTRNFKLNVMDNAVVNCTLGGGQGGKFFLRFHGCYLLAESHTFRPPRRCAPSTPSCCTKQMLICMCALMNNPI